MAIYSVLIIYCAACCTVHIQMLVLLMMTMHSLLHHLCPDLLSMLNCNVQKRTTLSQHASPPPPAPPRHEDIPACLLYVQKQPMLVYSCTWHKEVTDTSTLLWILLCYVQWKR